MVYDTIPVITIGNCVYSSAPSDVDGCDVTWTVPSRKGNFTFKLDNTKWELKRSFNDRSMIIRE
jgi:hypothetical protein